MITGFMLINENVNLPLMSLNLLNGQLIFKFGRFLTEGVHIPALPQYIIFGEDGSIICRGKLGIKGGEFATPMTFVKLTTLEITFNMDITADSLKYW